MVGALHPRHQRNISMYYQRFCDFIVGRFSRFEFGLGGFIAGFSGFLSIELEQYNKFELKLTDKRSAFYGQNSRDIKTVLGI